jgi:hypothetical protein
VAEGGMVGGLVDELFRRVLHTAGAPRQKQGLAQFAGPEHQGCSGIALDVVVPGHQRQRSHQGNDDQKQDDQRRDRPLEQWLGRQQAAIGGCRDDAGIPGNAVPPSLPVPGKTRTIGRSPSVRFGHEPFPEIAS